MIPSVGQDQDEAYEAEYQRSIEEMDRQPGTDPHTEPTGPDAWRSGSPSRPG